jgi:hypothetical protein
MAPVRRLNEVPELGIPAGLQNCLCLTFLIHVENHRYTGRPKARYVYTLAVGGPIALAHMPIFTSTSRAAPVFNERNRIVWSLGKIASSDPSGDKLQSQVGCPVIYKSIAHVGFKSVTGSPFSSVAAVTHGSAPRSPSPLTSCELASSNRYLPTWLFCD